MWLNHHFTITKIEEDYYLWHEIHLLSLWWSPLVLHFLINVTWSEDFLLLYCTHVHPAAAGMWESLVWTANQLLIMLTTREYRYAAVMQGSSIHTLYSPPLHPLPNTHTGVSPAPPLSVTAAKLPRAMAGHLWLRGQVPPPGQLWPPDESTVVFWKVDKFEQWWKKCDPPLYSTPYFTSSHGYRMCVRAHLNGNRLGKGTHPSFYCYHVRTIQCTARRSCWLSLIKMGHCVIYSAHVIQRS